MEVQFKTIHPVKYLEAHLSQNIRPDGRKFLNFRPVCINVSSIVQADSSAIFKLGSTAVVCGIKAKLEEPKVDPNHGHLELNVDLPPLCSPKFRPGPPSEQAQVLSQMVETIFNYSIALNLRDLCICKGKLVWVLYCDMLCMNYNGSVLDACIGALITALKTLSLPEVTYNIITEEIKVYPNIKKLLPVRTIPICTTFAIFNKEILIVDPTDDEESLSLGRLFIVMDTEEEACFVHKPGGIPISQDLLSKALEVAESRAKLMRRLINAAIPSKEARSKKSKQDI